MFTFTAVSEFLRQNDLLCVVRGHQVQDEGHQLFEPYRDNFPSLITLWSAPNYCDTYGNKASILQYDSVRNSADIKTFLSQPRPYVLPDFQNGLEWSLPYACRTDTVFIQALLDVCSEEELNEASGTLSDDDREDDSREYVDSGESSGQHSGQMTGMSTSGETSSSQPTTTEVVASADEQD